MVITLAVLLQICVNSPCIVDTEYQHIRIGIVNTQPNLNRFKMAGYSIHVDAPYRFFGLSFAELEKDIAAYEESNFYNCIRGTRE